MADNTDDLIISISTDQATLRRSIKRIEQDLAGLAGGVQKQFAAVGKSIDSSVTTSMQKRIDAMTGVGVKAAKEWNGALAEQGKELERLKAKYSPLFAAQQTYKTSLADIKRAHALGAISASEMTTALMRQKREFASQVVSIKARNAALADTPAMRGSGSFNASNLAAQGFDTLTTAPFMPWYTVALQQGPQVAAVFNDIKASGQSVGPAVAGAFKQILNPMSLATIGAIAASAAAIQYFTSIEWGGAKSEETLKKEAELIQKVAAQWDDALPNIKAYADERQRLVDNQELSDVIAIAASSQWDDLRKKLSDVNVEFTDMTSMIGQASDNTGGIVELQRLFNELSKNIGDGTAKAEDAKAVQDALASFASDTGIPAIAEFAKQFDALAKAIENSSDKAKKFDRDAAIALTSRFPSQGTYGGVIRSPDFTTQNEGLSLPSNGPTPTSRPNIELEGLPGADKANKKEETAAQKAANAYRDLIKSADDRIGQMQQEIDLLGKFGIEADAARFALDLLQKSEDKGRSLSEAQRAEIDKKVQAYKQLAAALATANLQQDLANQASLAGMSARDQKIVTMQRQYGLPEDASSATGKMIGQSIDQQEIADATKSFLSTFSNGLINEGKSLGEAFGDAVKAAAANAMQKSLESLFGQIANAIGAAFTGGKGTTGGISVLASAATSIGGAAAAAGSAGASAATGDIASYITKAAIARGIDPSVALRVAKSEGGLSSWNLQSQYMKNGVQEPSFGPFQLYKGGGLGNDFMAKTGLDPALAQNGPAGVDFALDHASKNGWGAWYGAKNTGIGNFEGIGTGASSASAALEKLAGASTETTKGLGSLASSLASSATGGGAGGFNWSSLFSSSFTPTTTYGAFLGLANGGSVRGPGSATSDSIPTMLSDGEYVVNARQTKKHRRLIEAINNGTVGRMADGGLVSPRTVSEPTAPRLATRGGYSGGNSGNPGVMMINISGASGDDHIRMLARQGTQEGIAAYNENQRRGGFGTLQTRYISQKG